jgi:hypothetical protein
MVMVGWLPSRQLAAIPSDVADAVALVVAAIK